MPYSFLLIIGTKAYDICFSKLSILNDVTIVVINPAPNIPIPV